MKKSKSLHRHTLRLEVRPFRLGDYPAWKSAHLSLPGPKNRWDRNPRALNELSLARFKRVLKDQDQQRKTERNFDLGVFLKSDGALIGGVSIMQLERGICQNGYLGYGIFNPHWGMGYAKESVKAGIDIAFIDLKLHRIEAGIEPLNRRSLSLARALKMRHEGCKRRHLFLRNQWVDLEIFSLTTEDLGMRFRGPKPQKISRT